MWRRLTACDLSQHAFWLIYQKMRAEEQYGEGGYRCESFGLLLVLVDGFVDRGLDRFQILGVGTTRLSRARVSRVLLPTMVPLAVEDESALLRTIRRILSSELS